MSRIATPIDERVYDICEDGTHRIILAGLRQPIAEAFSRSLHQNGKKNRLIRRRSYAFAQDGSIRYTGGELVHVGELLGMYDRPEPVMESTR